MILIVDDDSAVRSSLSFMLKRAGYEVKTAPVSLVLISDLSRFGDAKSARSQLMGAMDSGIVSQNISIFCSAANIATVPRASMDNEQLKKVLKLKDSQMPMMNHPVGYFK